MSLQQLLKEGNLQVKGVVPSDLQRLLAEKGKEKPEVEPTEMAKEGKEDIDEWDEKFETGEESEEHELAEKLTSVIVDKVIETLRKKRAKENGISKLIRLLTE